MRSPLVNETYINPRFHKLNEHADESNITNIVENDQTIARFTAFGPYQRETSFPQLEMIKSFKTEKPRLVVPSDVNEIGADMNTYRILSQSNESLNVIFFLFYLSWFL